MLRLVGAADTPTEERAACDWLCDGEDDYLEIQAALDEVPTTGGRVILMPGNYDLGGTGITVPTLCILDGFGHASVVTGSATALVTLSERSEVTHFELSAGSGHHLSVPESAYEVRIAAVRSVNPTNAHLYMPSGAIGVIAGHRDRLNISGLYYERPDDEPRADNDAMGSGRGVYDSFGFERLEQQIRELQQFKDKATLAFRMGGIQL